MEDPIVLFTEKELCAGGYVFPGHFFEHYKNTGSIQLNSDSVYRFYTVPYYATIRFDPICVDSLGLFARVKDKYKKPFILLYEETDYAGEYSAIVLDNISWDENILYNFMQKNAYLDSSDLWKSVYHTREHDGNIIAPGRFEWIHGRTSQYSKPFPEVKIYESPILYIPFPMGQQAYIFDEKILYMYLENNAFYRKVVGKDEKVNYYATLLKGLSNQPALSDIIAYDDNGVLLRLKQHELQLSVKFLNDTKTPTRQTFLVWPFKDNRHADISDFASDAWSTIDSLSHLKQNSPDCYSAKLTENMFQLVLKFLHITAEDAELFFEKNSTTIVEGFE